MLSNSILRGCIDVQIKYTQGAFFWGGGGVEKGVHEHPMHPLATALYKIIQCVAIFDSYMNNIIFRYPLLQVD